MILTNLKIYDDLCSKKLLNLFDKSFNGGSKCNFIIRNKNWSLTDSFREGPKCFGTADFSLRFIIVDVCLGPTPI